MTTNANHPVIWLQPWCDSCDLHSDEGRQWCQDNVWDKCDGAGFTFGVGRREGCKQMPVKYVLAPDQPKEELANNEG